MVVTGSDGSAESDAPMGRVEIRAHAAVEVIWIGAGDRQTIELVV